ncbi:DUF4136 domain-containing protein [Sediminitomix flava]|nr:DUF4136 domain-containing protein [Sediminitomix flava]
MKTIYYLLTILLITSCTTAQISSDYQAYTDFQQYNSFNFKSDFSPQEMNEFDQARFKRAISHSLADKGYFESEAPKMMIDMNVSTETKQRVVTYNNPSYYAYGPNFVYGNCGPYGGISSYYFAGPNFYRYPYAYRGGFAGYGLTPQQEVVEYEEWTLVVDFYDADNATLIWQGKMVIEDLDLDTSPKRKEQLINRYMEKLLKQYPPES